MIIKHYESSQSSLFEDLTGYGKKQQPKKIPHYKFIDLFAGIGGFRLGFQSKNSQCIFTSEWDQYSQKTYKANFKSDVFGDINQLDIKELEDFHIMLGGFPCQPFSKIGLRQGFKHKTQGNLFFNIVEILEVKRPTCFVLENVTGLLTHKTEGDSTIDLMAEVLSELGYEVNIGQLNASDFGVPQTRRRVFLVGFYKKQFDGPTNFKFPEKIKKIKYINEILESNVEGYAISKHLQNVYMYKRDDSKPLVVDKNSKRFATTLVSTYHKIQRLTGTFVKDGSTGLRLLSENECKELMGFPKKFKFPVSRTQMYRQLGNAVAVPVIKNLSKEVYKVLDKAYKIE
jgi:DNA (cytosine-5)-methyltransferase 1